MRTNQSNSDTSELFSQFKADIDSINAGRTQTADTVVSETADAG